MSSYAHASVVLGVTIDFTHEDFCQKATRYNQITGIPFEIQSPAFYIDVHCPGCETSVRIPNDTDLFCEAPEKSYYKPNFTNWTLERFRYRTHEWFESIGLKNDFSSDDNLFVLFRPYTAIVGLRILRGSSFQEKDRFVSCNIPDSQSVKNMIQEKLGQIFPGGNFNPQLYLITEQL